MFTLAGPLAALGSSVVFGTSDFLGGVLSRRFKPIVAVAWSHISACCLLSVIVLLSPWPTSWGWLPYAIGAGIAGATGLICFYTALASGTMGVVSPIAALGVLIPLTAALIGGEKPRITQLIGIGVALLGAILASGPELRHDEKVRARSVLWAGAAGIFFGLTMWGIVAGSRHSTLHTLWGMRATSSLGFLTLALVTHSVGGVSLRQAPRFVLLGALELGGNALLALSSKLGLVSVGVVLSSLYPVQTILLAAIFLHERIAGIQRWGVVAALMGVVLVNLPW